MKKGVMIVVLVIVAIVLAGFLFIGPKLKQQYSQGTETETNQVEQKNYIDLIGEVIKGKISPTNGNKVEGIIEISLTKVPERTDIINFAMIPSGRELSGQDLRADRDGSDGWSIFFDTNTQVNGLYDIFVLAEYVGRPDDEGPLDFASAQVIIEN